MIKHKGSEAILALFEPQQRALLQSALNRHEDILELRIRKEKPIVLCSAQCKFFLLADASLSATPAGAVTMTAAQVDAVFAKLCHYSVYSYQEKLNACYVTLPNGSRVGVACEAVVQSGQVTAVKGVSALNFRLVRQVRTAAAQVLEKLSQTELCSAIIIGAPCSGKTTLLREMCRLLSSGFAGEYRKCCVIDERGEIAAMEQGVSAYDIGVNTDVLSCFPKAQGILCALRTLSPEWIIADEIGSLEECRSIAQGFHSGVRFAVSLHAQNVEQARRKEQFRLLEKSGNFGAVVSLGSGEKLGKITEFVRL
ncbi:MAG: hypothetical protein IJJ41_00060 [Clostridia bacterium]|nr:hypothetical protein [Clostridia bacterium]